MPFLRRFWPRMHANPGCAISCIRHNTCSKWDRRALRCKFLPPYQHKIKIMFTSFLWYSNLWGSVVLIETLSSTYQFYARQENFLEFLQNFKFKFWVFVCLPVKKLLTIIGSRNCRRFHVKIQFYKDKVNIIILWVNGLSSPFCVLHQSCGVTLAHTLKTKSKYNRQPLPFSALYKVTINVIKRCHSKKNIYTMLRTGKTVPGKILLFLMAITWYWKSQFHNSCLQTKRAGKHRVVGKFYELKEFRARRAEHPRVPKFPRFLAAVERARQNLLHPCACPK